MKPYSIVLQQPINRYAFQDFIRAFTTHFNVPTDYSPLSYVNDMEVRVCSSQGYIIEVHLSLRYRTAFGSDDVFHAFVQDFIKGVSTS